MDGHGLTPLAGGFSGETFLAGSAGERVVVRIYAGRGARRERAAEIDAAVLHLVRGLLPVPEVLEMRRPDAAAGTPGPAWCTATSTRKTCSPTRPPAS